MTDETLQNDSSQTTENDNNQYIEALNEIKRNSVSKADYDALKAENKKLLDSIVNGTEAAQTVVQEKPDVQELRNKLKNYDANTPNLEFVKTAVELRDLLLEQGEDDPFVARGELYNPTQADYETAARVAAVYKECIELADGDNDTFVKELNKRIK